MTPKGRKGSPRGRASHHRLSGRQSTCSGEAPRKRGRTTWSQWYVQFVHMLQQQLFIKIMYED